MRGHFVALCLVMYFVAGAQSFNVNIRPAIMGEEVVLGKLMLHKNGDTLTIETLKCYLGDFKFWKDSLLVFADNTYRLLDLEDPNSMRLAFDIADDTAIDSICFNLGTDSLTNISGVMGGDLDPMRGMFWTWQSGYINFKMEGRASACPVRGGSFEFHLGGYMPPFQTVRQVGVAVSQTENTCLNMELAPFFQQVDWQKRSGIMSPCVEATKLMDVLQSCFGTCNRSK